MLKSGCIHPQLLHALALCGHGDKILIADGNYPLSTKIGDAERIYLGLCGGIPLVTDVLGAALHVVSIEKAELMYPQDGPEPEVFAEFRKLLPDVAFEQLGRNPFYEACKAENVKVAISTGEQRLYANILLTVAPAGK